MTQEIIMTPINKHIINSTVDWIIENECTPHLIINSKHKGTFVPQEYVNQENGQIVLNISPGSVRDYSVDKKGISFVSRFNGNVENIYIPIGSVLAVSVKENGIIIPLPPMPEDYYSYDKPDGDDKKDDKSLGNGLRLV